MAGLSEKQVHRILERMQLIALGHRSEEIFVRGLRLMSERHKMPELDIMADMVENNMHIAKENDDALIRDIQGMRDGNSSRR